MRVTFDTIFKIENGHVIALKPIRVGGVTIYGGAMDGIRVQGIDWSEQVGRDLEIKYIDKTDDNAKEVYIISGIY